MKEALNLRLIFCEKGSSGVDEKPWEAFEKIAINFPVEDSWSIARGLSETWRKSWEIL